MLLYLHKLHPVAMTSELHSSQELLNCCWTNILDLSSDRWHICFCLPILLQQVSGNRYKKHHGKQEMYSCMSQNLDFSNKKMCNIVLLKTYLTTFFFFSNSFFSYSWDIWKTVVNWLPIPVSPPRKAAFSSRRKFLLSGWKTSKFMIQNTPRALKSQHHHQLAK